jgi:adenylate cyclase
MTSVEGKLAAILSADVVGYSRLMAEDQDATVRTVTAYREEVELLVRQHQGRLVDFTGDEFLAEFPTAFESVRCAVEIQKVLEARNSELPSERRMQFRMGIHLGDVAVQEGRLFGDGVNIAARLQALAEAGGICISGNIHDLVHTKLGVGFDDLGTQSVKNIRDPVRLYRVKLDAAAAPPEAAPRSLRRMALAAPVVLLVAVAAFAGWRIIIHEDEPDPTASGLTVPGITGRPAIAVLPFDNLSGDPEQDYFVAGLAEDLITRLSSWRQFPVIARNSSFAYQGRAVDVRQVSRELGARYLVEGSVRRSEDRVRITAQLIDATTGLHVWAERYDRDLGDVFALQDEITEAIVGSMDPELLEFEGERATRRDPENLDAWELAQRGWWHFHQSTQESTAEARTFFERAIELDPHLTWAFAGLSMTHWRDAFFQWSDSRAQSVAEARRAAERSVELDDTDPHAQLALGHAYNLIGQWEESLAPVEAAIQLDPSMAWGHYTRGGTLAFTGRPDEAIPSLERAMRLSPHDPRTPAFYAAMGVAHFAAERYEEAVVWLQKSLQRNPEFLPAYSTLAASYAGALRS